MNTFLPLPNFAESAAVLDNHRLGKQRVECLQILQALKLGNRWSAHPATRMWSKHPSGLAFYGITICVQWMHLKRKDGSYFDDGVADQISDLYDPDECDLPWWFGNDRLHRCHRAALLYKNPGWYSQFGWTEKPIQAYWWPNP